MYLKFSPYTGVLVISNHPVCPSYSGCLRNNAQTDGLKTTTFILFMNLQFRARLSSDSSSLAHLASEGRGGLKN